MGRMVRAGDAAALRRAVRAERPRVRPAVESSYRSAERCDDRAMAADLAHLLAVARGDRPPDLVIEGARVFSAFTREWLEVDVGVADGRIAGFAPADGGRRIDGRGRHLVPGFVDAHVHVESSKLSVEEFSRLLLARGTTTVVADPHEFANVLGAP